MGQCGVAVGAVAFFQPQNWFLALIAIPALVTWWHLVCLLPGSRNNGCRPSSAVTAVARSGRRLSMHWVDDWESDDDEPQPFVLQDDGTMTV